MPIIQCFVCASDDGTFLDIFSKEKEYCQNIETCLSLKVPQTQISTSKLCHKCAYELEQCSKFVASYSKTKQRENGKLFKKQGFCCICMEPGEKGKIFDVWDQNPMNKCVEKIQKLFNDNLIPDDSCTLSICLDCRYNLDVLFDLKRLAEKPYKFSELTKMKTSVVNRRTAICRRPKLSQSSDSDSDMDPPTAKPVKPQKSARPTILSKSASSVKSSAKVAIPKKAASPDRVSVTPERSISPEKPETPSPLDKPKSPEKSESPIQQQKSPKVARECDTCHEKITIGSATYKFNATGERLCEKCWKTSEPLGELQTKKNPKLKIDSSMETKPCSVLVTDIQLFPDDAQASRSSMKNPKKKNLKVGRASNGDPITALSDDTSDDAQRLKKRTKQQQQKAVKKRKNSDEFTSSGLEKKPTEEIVSIRRETRASSVQVMPSTSKLQKTNVMSYSDDTDRIDHAPKKLRGRPRKYGSASKIISTKKRSQDLKSTSEDEKPRFSRVSKRSRTKSSSSVTSESSGKMDRSKKSQVDEIAVEPESEHNDSHVCNICQNEFESKVLLLTHNLTHLKKPTLLLKKVSISGDAEDNEKSAKINFTTTAEVLRADEPNADLNTEDLSSPTNTNTADSSNTELSSPEPATELNSTELNTLKPDSMHNSTLYESDVNSSHDKAINSPKDSSDEIIDVVASDPEFSMHGNEKLNKNKNIDKGMKITDLDTETETDEPIDVEYVKSDATDDDKIVDVDKSDKQDLRIVTDTTEIDSDQETTIIDNELKEQNELLDTTKECLEDDAEDDSEKPTEPAPKETVEEEPEIPNGILDSSEILEADKIIPTQLERTDSVASVEYPDLKLIDKGDELENEKPEEDKSGEINQDVDKTLDFDINESNKESEIIDDHSVATEIAAVDPPGDSQVRSDTDEKNSKVNDEPDNITKEIDVSTKSGDVPVIEN